MRKTTVIVLGVALLLVVVWILIPGASREPVSSSGIERGAPPPVERRHLAGRAPEAEAPTPGDEMQGRVRDLATGDGVPALSVRARGDSGTATRMTDDEGRFILPAQFRPLASLEPEDETWKVVDFRFETDQGIEMWAYREVQLTGTIQPESWPDRDRDLGQFAVDVRLVALPESHILQPSPYPWNEDTAQQMGWGGRGVTSPFQAPVTEDGTFQMQIPACRGLVARCTAPGWCPTWVELPVPDPEAASVSIVLRPRPMPTVRGRVVLPDAVPVGEVTTTANVVLECHATEYQPAFNRLYGVSYGATGTADLCSLQLTVDIRLQADGSFKVQLPTTDGKLHLVVHAPGHPPVRASLPEINPSNTLEVHVGGGDDTGKPSTFTLDGEPAAGWTLVLADITDESLQTATRAMTLDAQGRLPHPWLEPGRVYWIILHRQTDGDDLESMDGYLRYSGEDRIEMLDLLQDYDRAFGR